jgi:hypothetical protein
MSRKKLVALFVGFCLSLAPIFGYATDYVHPSAVHLSADYPSVTRTAAAHIPGHEIDCSPTHLATPPLSDAGTDLTGDPAIHPCCFNYVAILSPAIRIQLLHGAVALTAFHPSLITSSWSDGPYRPPRQIS